MRKCALILLRRRCLFAGEFAEEIFKESERTCFGLWQLLLYESG
jgi:hypothetical protein